MAVSSDGGELERRSWEAANPLCAKSKLNSQKYDRLGLPIEKPSPGRSRPAIRRKIVSANGQAVQPETVAMEDYTRDEPVDTLRSVMRKNTEYEREDIIRATAEYLGFKRLRETVKAPIKSAINAAIRRGVLGYERSVVRREG